MRLPDEELVQLVNEFQPDVLFHCAGSALPAKSFTSPSHDFQCAVPVVQHLLEAVRRSAPVAHIVLLSSAAVYGQPVAFPISEDVPPAPVSPYGFHKWLGEILAREYAEIYGMRISSARIFSAYGPRLTKQVVWDSIRKLQVRVLLNFPERARKHAISFLSMTSSTPSIASVVLRELDTRSSTWHPARKP